MRIKLHLVEFTVFGILSAPALFFELELFFLVQALTLFHARLGINNICKDYLHNPLLQVLYFSMFRILVIELININLNFWY
uniref:Succinate:cytochrome c oxidoreductase subunit 4 n=1 Tax=Hildenbrandia rubra TaxID=31481 RepID=A0A0A7A717_9FLOR|nr:succinate:cytochrome c oxidoreductase subunit 4 [Hildenbrandia rubra]AHB62138.1 succinate:cytochrome c oxidoreductase subunit 4 [Hildenbrandia rubra]